MHSTACMTPKPALSSARRCMHDGGQTLFTASHRGGLPRAACIKETGRSAHEGLCLVGCRMQDGTLFF